MRVPGFARAALLVVATLAVSVSWLDNAQAGKSDWPPVTPEDLDLKEPKVEKGADAEALFWNVEVEDRTNGGGFATERRSQIRVKVFTAKGAEARSHVEIPFDENTRIEDIAGRTVLPTGKIVELKREDVFDQTVVKVRGRKVRVKSFILPGVERGAILDYRWTEVYLDQLSIDSRLQFQRDIPVQRLVYRILPLAIPYESNYTMKTKMFNGVSMPFDHEPDGYFRISVANVPAFHEEPDMPPEPQVRPWMLLWYGPGTEPAPDKFWNDYGRSAFEVDKSSLKVSKELRGAADRITEGATDPDQKLERLFQFCRAEIRNLSDDVSTLTAEERSKLKNAKNADVTLRSKQGTATDVDYLFATLASAAGFDVRIARVGDRSDMPFDANTTNDLFLQGFCVAVRVADQWRFFDPAVTYVPYGMLPWWNEGTTALIPDEKNPVLFKTANSPSNRSRCRRIATLKLAANGDLSGDCRIEYTGHWGTDMKETYDDESPEDREKALVEIVAQTIGSATVTQVVAENVTDPVKPFTWRFHIEAPGYAQAAGSRLFVQPGVFQRAREPRFTASQRQHPIQFDYMWSEEDSVTIELPPGTAPEGIAQPQSLEIGNFGKLGSSVTSGADGRLVYKRSFNFDRLSFVSGDYPLLKDDFEKVHQIDSRSLALHVTAGE